MASTCPVAIVTGAAQGIGFAISDSLLQGLYRVCLTDVNTAKGQESVAQLQKKYGPDRVMFLKCDVTSDSEFQEAFLKTQQTFGRIDLLVNNAGVLDEFNPQLTIATNLMGPLYGCQLAFKFLGISNGGKGGAVVNVASAAGLRSHPSVPAYSASKHGVVGLTRSYGHPYHFDRDGVSVMAVLPHAVRTDMLTGGKPLFPFPEELIKDKLETEFVAEGVMKLLKDRLNGSTLVCRPNNYYYHEIEDKFKNVVM